MNDALSAPFENVSFRLDAKKPDHRGMFRCLVYLDARDVCKRLTDAVPGWSCKHAEPVYLLGKNKWDDDFVHVSVACTITIPAADSHWVERSDVGSATGRPDDENVFKSAYSDALKRAAVPLGVGAYLYKLDPFAVGEAHVWFKKSGDAGGLKDSARAELMRQYNNQVKVSPSAATPPSIGGPFSTDLRNDVQLMNEYQVREIASVAARNGYTEKQVAAMVAKAKKLPGSEYERVRRAASTPPNIDSKDALR